MARRLDKSDTRLSSPQSTKASFFSQGSENLNLFQTSQTTKFSPDRAIISQRACTTMPSFDSPFGNDDPWAVAKTRFIADLDDKERELFHNASLENLYYSASNVNRQDSENSKTRITIRKLGPLVSAIENYGKALDTFSNIAPLYLAPIWGSIRVVLVVAGAHGKFYDRIVDTLERIGDILPRFRKLLPLSLPFFVPLPQRYSYIFRGLRTHLRSTKASTAYPSTVECLSRHHRALHQIPTINPRTEGLSLSKDSQAITL
jgi:hypothetical protein